MKSMFCSTIYKATTASPTGLHLWSPPTGGAIILVHLDDHGLFARKLKAGLQIERINDLDCSRMTVAAVQAHLQQLVGRVTVWASAPQWGASSSPTPSVVSHSDDDDDDDDDDDACWFDDATTSHYALATMTI